MGKIVGIVLVVALLGFGAYKIFMSGVDRSNPDAVGAAFLQALEKEDLGRAKKYFLPEQADAWEASTKTTLGQMKTNGMTIFRDAIPDEPTFTAVPTDKLRKGSVTTDKWMKSGDAVISMREVEGDWYVTHCSVP